MRPRERPTANSRVCPQQVEIPIFDDRAHLHVAQLANVDVASVDSPRPAQEDIARRLHQTLTRDDSMAVVLMQALPHVRLQHRGLRFFYLQEKRVVVRRKEESDGAQRADAADSDRLNRQVAKMKAVEQHADMLGQ